MAKCSRSQGGWSRGVTSDLHLNGCSGCPAEGEGAKMESYSVIGTITMAEFLTPEAGTTDAEGLLTGRGCEADELLPFPFTILLIKD